MQNKKFNLKILNDYLIIIVCLFISAVFQSCVEEKQISDAVQQPEKDNTDQNTDEPIVKLPGLPDDVAGYEQWLKINADPIPPVVGGDPHNGTKNVYVNKKRDEIAPEGEQQFPYPDGSIVVKDATRPGKDYIGLIAIMRKKAGSDPDHNDWEFIEYTRNDPEADFAVIASGRICWGCHARAEDTDYVFTELE